MHKTESLKRAARICFNATRLRAAVHEPGLD